MGIFSKARTIKSAREARGLSVAELGESLGMTEAAARELECHEDEIEMCMSIDQLVQLCTVLSLKLHDLFPEVKTVSPLEFDILRDRIEQHCQTHSLTRDQFVQEAGCAIEPFMSDPKLYARTWHIDCLKDVCTFLGQDWRPYLKNIERTQTSCAGDRQNAAP